MSADLPAMQAKTIWTLWRGPSGLWHWKRADDLQSDMGFAALVDCLENARANGYEPGMHLLRMEPGGNSAVG